MNTPLIRNGKLVADAFEGHDLTRLDYEQRSAIKDAVEKSNKGQSLSRQDLDGLMKAYAASRPAQTGGTGNPLADAVGALGRAETALNTYLGKG